MGVLLDQQGLSTQLSVCKHVQWLICVLVGESENKDNLQTTTPNQAVTIETETSFSVCLKYHMQAYLTNNSERDIDK